MATPGREAPLAGTGLVRQYKPQKTPFRQRRAVAPPAKNHWVCLPMASSETVRESCPNRAGKQPGTHGRSTRTTGGKNTGCNFGRGRQPISTSSASQSEGSTCLRALHPTQEKTCRKHSCRPSVRTLIQVMAGRRCSATLHPLSPLWRYAAMKIVVSASSRNPACPWQVQLDQHVVSFRSEAEARAFVATLETRLQAPHPLMREPWPASVGSAARH